MGKQISQFESRRDAWESILSKETAIVIIHSQQLWLPTPGLHKTASANSQPWVWEGSWHPAPPCYWSESKSVVEESLSSSVWSLMRLPCNIPMVTSVGHKTKWREHGKGTCWVGLSDRGREDIREGGEEGYQNELYTCVKLPMSKFN